MELCEEDGAVRKLQPSPGVLKQAALQPAADRLMLYASLMVRAARNAARGVRASCCPHLH